MSIDAEMFQLVKGTKVMVTNTLVHKESAPAHCGIFICKGYEGLIEEYSVGFFKISTSLSYEIFTVHKNDLICIDKNKDKAEAFKWLFTNMDLFTRVSKPYDILETFTLRELRLKHNLSIKEIAEQLNVSIEFYEQLETFIMPPEFLNIEKEVYRFYDIKHYQFSFVDFFYMEQPETIKKKYSLRMLRKEHNLLQKDIAKLLDIHHSEASQIETWKNFKLLQSKKSILVNYFKINDDQLVINYLEAKDLGLLKK